MTEKNGTGRMFYGMIQEILQQSGVPMSKNNLIMELKNRNLYSVVTKYGHRKQFDLALDELIEDNKIEVDTAFDTQFYRYPFEKWAKISEINRYMHR